MVEKQKEDKICKVCKGLGYVQEKKNGPVHTCWECLKKGRLNPGDMK
jgi:hypothetical protein